MLNKIIEFSLKNRFLVIFLTVLICIGGMISLKKLPIDAFPDTTPVQVAINTVAPSLSPTEIEQQITFPIEQAVSGLPGLKQSRSISKFGLSQVLIVFEDGTDIYFARQLVMERLQAVDLPEGMPKPQLGPVATGLGEVFHYLVEGDERHSLTDVTTANNWIIKPQLRTVPGVAEVNTWGGFEKQYQVLVDPELLAKYNLSFADVSEALNNNNRNAGGGTMPAREGEAYLLHGIGRVTGIESIKNIFLRSEDGVSVRIRDVAEVVIGHEIRRAAVSANGEGENVLGLGFMLMGENSAEVTLRLREKLNHAAKSLPEGMTVSVVYDRTDLVNQVIDTVKNNLMEGALFVVAILFIFLGNLRAGLIVALAIPLSMLCAFSGMLQAGIAGSLMSLGAIDFGLVVDSSVIMVENAALRLSENKEGRSRLDVVRDAAIEVRKPTMFGELIIMIVYLPILTLQGVEGKLFQPMALTVIFALAASMVLSLTLMPVLASLLLPKKIVEKELLIVRAMKKVYAPLLRTALKLKVAICLTAILILSGSIWMGASLGAEFVPRLNEGALVVNTVRLAGVSIPESVRYGNQIEKMMLKEFPDEIDKVWTRTGTPEVATDPMGIEVSDMFITLKPREQWTKAKNQEELVIQMSRAMQGLPGMKSAFSQPIEMRVNEMTAGIRTDLGIKIFGDDFDKLVEIAEQVETLVNQTGGAKGASTEQITGQPVLRIKVRPEDIARFGISTEDILTLVESIGGKENGEVYEKQMRFDLVVRLAETYRQDADAVKKILITANDGKRIPLEEVADVVLEDGPTVINREWSQRRIVVSCNVRERDVASFVDEIRSKIKESVSLPTGYHIEYGGQFENFERARTRLMIVVPIVLVLIFFLLYTTFKSTRDALIIFTGIPFAAVGGIMALKYGGMPFSISAGVGFIALSGISVLDGLVLVSCIRNLMKKGAHLQEAVPAAALSRLRPVMMTSLVAGIGFIPMALSTGVGAEVQRPLAFVVIGGVISANILTLMVLPVLYSLFGKPVISQED
ncbi:CusA/CzcA family heavy metal efflux RND transporter [Lentisphaera marina]|uniref:efflux RND transporter permease subunit n=1 Tax=Lentisphaera marina TaxID=1111041 RepID=UPI0023661D85|nr:CusA/CzcA family heavy metal efflux RND transporter [Lentisphaera marina]MDD7984356.1 CusA/CzcA family heavy metal efflux RND transporter [Lentisphaera marina]